MTTSPDIDELVLRCRLAGIAQTDATCWASTWRQAMHWARQALHARLLCHWHASKPCMQAVSAAQATHCQICKRPTCGLHLLTIICRGRICQTPVWIGGAMRCRHLTRRVSRPHPGIPSWQTHLDMIICRGHTAELMFDLQGYAASPPPKKGQPPASRQPVLADSAGGGEQPSPSPKMSSSPQVMGR